MASILVVFHSVGGYTFRMAEAIADGVCSLTGCEAKLKQIVEPPGAEAILLPKLQNRRSEFSHIPIVQVEDLAECDGLAIGTPVFFGNMSSATSYFFEQTMKIWTLPPDPVKPPEFLLGKPATVFTAGGSGLACELPIQSLWTTLAFYGMTIVTVGMNTPEVTDASEAHGGSPLGAGTFSRAPGERPSEKEFAIARAQGRALAEVARAWRERRTE